MAPCRGRASGPPSSWHSPFLKCQPHIPCGFGCASTCGSAGTAFSLQECRRNDVGQQARDNVPTQRLRGSAYGQTRQYPTKIMLLRRSHLQEISYCRNRRAGETMKVLMSPGWCPRYTRNHLNAAPKQPVATACGKSDAACVWRLITADATLATACHAVRSVGMGEQNNLPPAGVTTISSP